jgi:hypothetical protein
MAEIDIPSAFGKFKYDVGNGESIQDLEPDYQRIQFKKLAEVE